MRIEKEIKEVVEEEYEDEDDDEQTEVQNNGQEEDNDKIMESGKRYKIMGYNEGDATL